MTDAELIELSLRARIASLDGDVRAIMRARSYYFGDFRISSNFENVVMISRRQSSEAFFCHRVVGLSSQEIDPVPNSKDITCTNDERARELLLELRAAQVLDQLAGILGRREL